MKADYYNLTAHGKHVRVATRVILPDGRVIAFLDKIGKRKAVDVVSRMTKRELESAVVIGT